MKKWLWVVTILIFAGCTYKGQSLETYIEEPETIIRDPHFGSYQTQLDSLESEYLAKKITYAQYLEQKEEIEKKYNKEVKERDAIVVPEN